MGWKLEGCTPFRRRELRPHLTECRLGRGLPPYKVASLPIQPFGHNRHGPKIGGGSVVPPFWGLAGSPSTTMWPGQRPTSMPSFILIHETVWPQYTNVTDRTGPDRQTDRGKRSDSIGQTVLETVAQKLSDNILAWLSAWGLIHRHCPKIYLKTCHKIIHLMTKVKMS